MTRGVIFSQMVLLKLIEKGMSREGAYAIVQKHAMQSWEKGKEFKPLLMKDRGVMACMNRRELDAVFRVENFLGQINFIFKRVFGDLE
jgi:adenylosuccinate lyase